MKNITRLLYLLSILLSSSGYSISYTENDGKYIVQDGDEKLILDPTDKPCFDSGMGECVTEYTGLATDGTKEKSWAIAVFAPEGSAVEHSHKIGVEDYYIISGNASVFIDGIEHKLKAREHITIKINQRHKVINNSQEEELKLLVKCVPAWTPNDFYI